MLVVGDDEQVLYDKLKSGMPKLIRQLYENNDYVKGMLPFCSRSSFHITKTTGYFIQQDMAANRIKKVYLPIKTNDGRPKVQVIACAAAATAVDYIEKFVADNKAEIDARKKELEDGKAKDAFLLILTPAKEVNFYGQSKEKIKQIALDYQAEYRSFSKDYYKLLNYYSLANNPSNNFSFRKALHYEAIQEERVHEFIDNAMSNSQNFCDLNSKDIRDLLQKCNEIKVILDADSSIEEKVDQILSLIAVVDKNQLLQDIEQRSINQDEIIKPENEGTELEEIAVKKMGSIELMSIVGSKGLSADHVIIIGFDNVNMQHVTKNAFYVAATRARKSLHILTALKSGGAIQAHDFLDQLPDEHVEFFKYTKKEHTKEPLQNKQIFKDYLFRLLKTSQASSSSRRQR